MCTLSQILWAWFLTDQAQTSRNWSKLLDEIIPSAQDFNVMNHALVMLIQGVSKLKSVLSKAYKLEFIIRTKKKLYRQYFFGKLREHIGDLQNNLYQDLSFTNDI